MVTTCSARLGASQRVDDVPGVAVGELDAVGDHRHDDRARRFALAPDPATISTSASSSVMPLVRHREQAADRIRQPRRRRWCSPRRIVGRSASVTTRDLVARRPFAPRTPTGRSRMKTMSSAAAALLSTSSAMSIGSVARETRSTSRRAPSSRTTKASGPSPSTGSPSLSTRADEQRALAASAPGPVAGRPRLPDRTTPQGRRGSAGGVTCP